MKFILNFQNLILNLSFRYSMFSGCLQKEREREEAENDEEAQS